MSESHPIRYYRRYYVDGSCSIICTHCFATVGTALDWVAAGELEGRHICGEAQPPEFADVALREIANFRRAEAGWPERRASLLEKLRRAHPMVTLLAVVVALYGVPTLIEKAAMGPSSPWVGVILLGDLAGCVCLALLLEMPAAAMILYVGLTACEAYLYGTGLMSAGRLMWVVDVVPTLVVGLRVTRWRAAPTSRHA